MATHKITDRNNNNNNNIQSKDMDIRELNIRIEQESGFVQNLTSGMDKVIKTTVFLSDMNNFAAMNAVYETFFPAGNCPARSAVEVARLPKDAMVEIEAVAHL